MNIFMMAAGGGARFAEAGYTVAKPFVRIHDGSRMWEHVARQIGITARMDVSLVTRQELAKQCDINKDSPIQKLRLIPNMVGPGPAWSAIAATLELSGSEGFLLLDCDCFVNTHGGQTQIQQILSACQDQAVVFATVAEQQTSSAASVIGATIVEGGVIAGGLLNVGAYWFPSLEVFRKKVALLSASPKVEEVKISNVFNALSERTHHVLNGTFINLGTPADLNAYKG